MIPAMLVSLGVSGTLWAASFCGDLKHRTEDDLVRCRFIIEEVCARLRVGDRAGAAAFVVPKDPASADFTFLPADQGEVVSCRETDPSRLRLTRPKAMPFGLRLTYASRHVQDVGIRFGRLGGSDFGYISEVAIGPQWFIEGGRKRADMSFVGSGGVSQGPDERAGALAAGAMPEQDDSPKAGYLETLLKQIGAERERRKRKEERAEPGLPKQNGRG